MYDYQHHYAHLAAAVTATTTTPPVEEEEAETADGRRPNIKIPLEQQLDRVGCRGRAPRVPLSRARPLSSVAATTTTATVQLTASG